MYPTIRVMASIPQIDIPIGSKGLVVLAVEVLE
jgi:hypothetical protein